MFIVSFTGLLLKDVASHYNSDVMKNEKLAAKQQNIAIKNTNWIQRYTGTELLSENVERTLMADTVDLVLAAEDSVS